MIHIKRLVVSISAVFFLYGPAFGQTTTTTPFTGYIASTVAGGTAASPQSTLLSPTLTNPIVFQGVISAISGPTITISNASFTAGEFNGANGEFYVEVFSATAPGAISDITATSATTVTTAGSLSAFATAGYSIAIRQHVTIADFLGANNSWGLQAGSSLSVADEVLIYDGATPTTYWYYDGSLGGSAGWVDINRNAAGSIGIGPWQGIVIKRKAAGNVSIVWQGQVKTGNTLFPVDQGTNVLGTLSATGLTLDSSGLFNGALALTGSGDVSTADAVFIYNGAVPSLYWYYNGSLGGTAGWVDSNFNLVGSTAIPPGTAIVVNRKVGAAFNWIIPAPSSF